jgi:hypothetical protein
MMDLLLVIIIVSVLLLALGVRFCRASQVDTEPLARGATLRGIQETRPPSSATGGLVEMQQEQKC